MKHTEKETERRRRGRGRKGEEEEKEEEEIIQGPSQAEISRAWMEGPDLGDGASESDWIESGSHKSHISTQKTCHHLTPENLNLEQRVKEPQLLA